MFRRFPMFAAAAAAFTVTALSHLTVAAERPNIVVILADDQGWGDLSVHGNSNLSTPHIDSLARDGALFDRFYVCPVCSPTRAEFLTGRYHPRGGVWSTSTGGERLDLDEKTIGDTFKAAGYATAAFGKWHNGSQFPYHPNGRGFDEYYGFPSGHWGEYFDPPLEHNGQFVKGKGYITDDLTDHAMAFIEQNRERPFFCYMPFNTPHSPMQVPDRFYDKFRNSDVKMRHQDADKEELGMTRAALAMCENIDWNVGRLLKKLDELKLSERTIVLYFSDNGPNSFRWNGGMKGRKGSTDEGGVRSPLLVRWPGRVPPRKSSDTFVSLHDIVPTILEACGEPVPKKVQAQSLVPMLTGKAKEHRQRVFIEYAENEEAMVRTDRWAFMYGSGKRQREDGYTTGRPLPGRTIKLYDMHADPGQTTNIAGRPEHAAVVRELTLQLLAYLRATARQPELIPRTEDVHELLDHLVQPRDIANPPKK
jgi:arylsulfatase A-like enzyme